MPRGLWTAGRLWITWLDQEAVAVTELEADDAEPEPDFDSDFDGLAFDVDLPLVRDSEAWDSAVRDSDFLSAPDSDLPLALSDSDLP